MLERFQDAEEAKLGLTPAHIEAVRFTTVPKGLAAAAMSASQHDILRALLEAYVRCLPDHLADGEMAKITGPSFPSLRLAWAGSEEPRTATLLPYPGASLAGRVRQHHARWKPRARGMARSGSRLWHGRIERPSPARSLTRKGAQARICISNNRQNMNQREHSVAHGF